MTDCSETVLVAGENNKNVVLLSEKSYSNMMENIHAMGSEANYSWLIESKKQLENGSASPHERPGESYGAAALQERVYAEIFEKHRLGEICGDCEWYPLCARLTGERKEGSGT